MYIKIQILGYFKVCNKSLFNLNLPLDMSFFANTTLKTEHMQATNVSQ